MATIQSPASAPVGVSTQIFAWFLKDPSYPALNITLNVIDQFASQVADHEGTFEVLGRTNSVVITDGPGGEDIPTLDVLTSTAADYKALETITTSGRVLYLTSPFGEAWYVAVTKRTRKLIASAAATPWRTTTLELVNVDAP